MAFFDKFMQDALNKQKEEFEQQHYDELEYIKETRKKLLNRLEKSREYRIMLREYQQELISKEKALDERERLLQQKEFSYKKQLECEMDAKLINERKRLADETIKLDQERLKWKEYVEALRSAEFTIMDWCRRIEKKEISAFKEIVENADKFKKYSESFQIADGFQFEEHVAEILRANGFSEVFVTKKSQDFGADITACKEEVRYVVQCKYYTAPVGIEAVQQILGAKYHYGSHVAAVATNSVFTMAAKTLAAETKVLLWDGQKLNEMIIEK